MKFKKHVEKDPDFPGPRYTGVHWLSDNGRYKIKQYFDTPEAPKRAIFYAYHKPIGWNAFGNHVNRKTPTYKTWRAAVAACKKHLEENPNGAYQ